MCTLHIVNKGHVFMRLCVYSHHTPQAILLGLEGQHQVIPAYENKSSTTNSPFILSTLGSDPETIDTGTIPSRYSSILSAKSLLLGGKRRIHYDMDRDMRWRWDQVLKTHPNGMRFSAFGEGGELLATNEYFRFVLLDVRGHCCIDWRPFQCRRWFCG